MKNLYSRFIAMVIAFCVVLTNINAYGAWDGYKELENIDGKTVVVDMDTYSVISSSGAGATIDYVKSSQYSALWLPETTKVINFKKSIPTDWSEYKSIQFWMYSGGVKNTQFVFLVFCNTGYFVQTLTVDWAGWKLIDIPLLEMGGNGGPKLNDISYIQFNSSGWGSFVEEGTLLAIDDIVLKKPNSNLVGSMEERYDELTLGGYIDFAKENVALYDRTATVLADGKISRLDKENVNIRTMSVDNVTAVPYEFFDHYLGSVTTYTNGKYTAKLNNNTVSFEKDNPKIKINGSETNAEIIPFESEGKLYVPALQLAQGLGLFTHKKGALSVFSKTEENILEENGLEEIVSYAASYYNTDTKDVTECDFKQLAKNWREFYVGNEENDLTDEHILARVKEISNTGYDLMQSMIKEPTKRNLWGKIDVASTNAMTLLYEKIYKMALAYGTYGSDYYKNENMKKSILYALEWGYNNLYGEKEMAGKGWRSTSEYNWWDWRIGTAKHLINTIIIMGDDIESEKTKKYAKALDAFGQLAVGIGSNRLNGCYVQAGIAIITKDSKRLKEARDGIDETVWYQDGNGGAGMHTDGSYVYHGKHPMNGAYGAEQVEVMSPLVSILYGTKFETTGLLSKYITEWFDIAYKPFFYNGSFMSMVAGRGVLSSDKSIGAVVLKAYIGMLDLFDKEEQVCVKAFIKDQIQNSKEFYQINPTINELNIVNAIMKDESIEASSEYLLNKVYYNMDRVVQHSGNYSAGVAMSSSRIYNYESINNQNSKGWYIGDGMLYVYTKGQTSFDPLFWILSDPYKRPGTTVDTQERQALQIHGDYTYLSDEDFVGGVSDGTHGVAAMKLDAYSKYEMDGFEDTSYGVESPLHDCTLEAKKSWFLFDDEIVALGSDINADDGHSVLTVLDNRQSKKAKSVSGEKVSAYEIKNVAASAEPQSENPAKHAVDGSLETRWSAEGKVYIDLDLGEVKPVGYAGIAIYYGNSRVQNLKIELSENGKDWVNVYEGQSSGTTEDIELYDLKASKARYVRVHGNEATTSTWNSFTEICIYPHCDKSAIDLGMGEYVTEDKIIVDGEQVAFNSGETKQFKSPRWFNTENCGGWFFPEEQVLSIKTSNNSRVFVESWLEHGVSPKSGSYSYIQLPDFSPEETVDYTKNPDIEIIANTASLQAVREKTLGKTGMVFWESGSCENITASSPLLLTMEEKDNFITLHISDPTHKLKTTEVTVKGANLRVIDKDDEAEIITTQSEAVIKLSVDGSRGKTFSVKLAK